MNVLIVDDSVSARSILRQMVRKMRHETIEAANGKEALAQLETHPDVGLILLDWNMPEMDGMELLDAIREKRGSLRKPLIIVVSTESEREKIMQAVQRGADEYIMKPFTKEILLEKLALLGIDYDNRL